jgi:hypothetical protein
MIPNHTKKCSHCQEEKDITQFPKRSVNPDGFDTHCKICRNLKGKSYRDGNKDKYSSMRKAHYDKNITKMRAEKVKYCASHKEEKKSYDLTYREQNKFRIKEYKKKWEQKMRNDPIFKIKRNLRRRVHHVLKGNRKADKTFNLIGCTAEEFKKHIESLWKEGMSWDNYGPKGWHVDHIIPCYKFNLLRESEQRKCFHYTNQRPLWAKENLSRKRNETLP